MGTWGGVCPVLLSSFPFAPAFVLLSLVKRQFMSLVLLVSYYQLTQEKSLPTPSSDGAKLRDNGHYFDANVRVTEVKGTQCCVSSCTAYAFNLYPGAGNVTWVMSRLRTRAQCSVARAHVVSSAHTISRASRCGACRCNEARRGQ